MLQILLVDDENDALEALEWKLNNYIDNVEVTKCNSPIAAIDIINEDKPDVVFLDIQMPEMDGFTMIEKLENRDFNLIFTTAHDEFALKAIKVSAIDYLLKPIDYATFLKASNKAKKWFDLQNLKPEQINSNEDFLFIKSEYKILKVKLKDIKYIEGMREYVRIHLTNEKPIMTLLSMKVVAQQLPSNSFMRIHRSYIVNLNMITTIERNRIVFDKVYIPVSENYKEDFQQFISKNFLS